MIYAWRYPAHTLRSVLIAVNPPGGYLWDAQTTGQQIRRYAALCAQDSSCRSRTPDLAASIHSAYEHIPGRFWFLPVKKGAAATTAFWGLMQATSAAEPISAPMTIDTLLSAGHGDGSGSWFLALMGQLAFPTAQVWGDVAAVSRTDAAYAQRFFATHADRGSAIGAPGTDFVWPHGKLLGSWPASPDENQYAHVPDSKVETLLVGGNVDFATPPQNATRALLPHLPNGHQVILANLGHTDDFWAYEACFASGHLVNTFFDRRTCRRVPVHAEPDRLRARHKSGRAREDRARRDARAGGADGVLAALVAAAPAAGMADRSDRWRAVLCGLRHRSCSASAAGSPECSSC